MMQAHAATDAISQMMWKRALRALGVGVEAAVSPQCCVPLQVHRSSAAQEYTTPSELHQHTLLWCWNRAALSNTTVCPILAASGGHCVSIGQWVRCAP